MATTTMPVQRHAAPWWLGAIVGVATIIVGILLLTDPGMTMVVLVQLLGLYWLAVGMVQLAALFVDSSRWGWKLAGGILGIIAGLVTIQHPLWATVVLPATAVIAIGLLGLLYGVMAMINAFSGGGWAIGIIGAVSVIFGLLVMANPLGPMIALPFILGLLAIAGGVMGTIFAIRDRKA